MSIDRQIWKTIHIIGKTFTPRDEDTKKAFVCFFDCLGDLLPDENYKRTLKSFISQVPPENYLFSSESSFKWTYDLHSYVNLIKKRSAQLTDDITLSKAQYLYSNITKTDWGNSFWFIMHYIAANLPEKLDYKYRTAFIALIMCIRFLIPCDECKYHMTEYITKTDIYPFMYTRRSAFQYTWLFHNAVSIRVGKKPMTNFEEAFRMYNTRNNVYTMIDY